jgi:hypothetical protein
MLIMFARRLLLVCLLSFLYVVNCDYRIEGKIDLKTTLKSDPTIDQKSVTLTLTGSQLEKPISITPHLDGSFILYGCCY